MIICNMDSTTTTKSNTNVNITSVVTQLLLLWVILIVVTESLVINWFLITTFCTNNLLLLLCRAASAWTDNAKGKNWCWWFQKPEVGVSFLNFYSYWKSFLILLTFFLLKICIWKFKNVIVFRKNEYAFTIS